MVMHIRFIIFWSIFSSYFVARAGDEETLSSATKSPRFSEISMEISESREIPLAKGVQVQVSRKGILDLQLYSNHLRLVAVKSGLVVVTITHEKSGEEDFKYFVEVKNKNAVESTGSQSLDSLCRGSGLRYDEDKGRVRGRSDDFLQFYKVKELCDADALCSFEAELSQRAKVGLEHYVRNLLGERFEVLVKETGAIITLARCSDSLAENGQKRIVEHLLGLNFVKKHVLVVCRKELYSNSYLLFSKIIVLEKSAANELGLQTGLDRALALGLPNFGADLDLQLRAALKTKRAQIIGEPVIWLLGGSEARLQSGSEILVTRDSNERLQDSSNVYAWKDLGLDLKVKVYPMENKKVRLQYSFLVSNASSKGNSQIQRNRIESEIELSLERSAIVGGIQFKSEGRQESSIPFVDSIPILGPLLKISSSNDLETSLYLHFFLKASDGDGLKETLGSPLHPNK